ncbi:MAG: Ureidoglycolate lyase [Eubacterium sp.]|jgi:2-keto-4-pentenoate hydratase/2-oxohepta-3-ene-1,7-dioic acid hydratase in catechol pathway|nr:Ureidoglycolate lyase [Eubacterium sp.]
MIYLRFLFEGLEKTGILNDTVITEVEGDIFANPVNTGREYQLSDVKLLAPCKPGKVVAVGLNYVDHVKEFSGRDIPKNPVIFIKLPHTVIGPGDTILLPEASERVDYEAEFAVVIGKYCKNVEPEQASDYIFGATCLNDVTARDIQKSDGQWIRGKNYETFCPIGPYIVTGLDYSKLDVKLLLNGEVKQHGDTSMHIFDTDYLISFISKVIPLEPGDVVTTGTPEGVGPIKDGDIVEVEIEGIGKLTNLVKKP